MSDSNVQEAPAQVVGGASLHTMGFSPPPGDTAVAEQALGASSAENAPARDSALSGHRRKRFESTAADLRLVEELLQSACGASGSRSAALRAARLAFVRGLHACISAAVNRGDGRALEHCRLEDGGAQLFKLLAVALQERGAEPEKSVRREDIRACQPRRCAIVQQTLCDQILQEAPPQAAPAETLCRKATRGSKRRASALPCALPPTAETLSLLAPPAAEDGSVLQTGTTCAAENALLVVRNASPTCP